MMINYLPMKFLVSALVLSALSIAAGNPATGQPTFSAAPIDPLHGYDISFGRNVQKFNGLFVRRLIDQTSREDARHCLRTVDAASLTIETYDSGDLRLHGAASCANGLITKSPVASASLTSRVSISGARILALVLAGDSFNSQTRFAKNDRELSHYDVLIYDRDGAINVSLEPRVRFESVIAGCPSAGPIGAVFLVDPNTFAVKVGRMVC